jgi:hypothetical protein
MSAPVVFPRTAPHATRTGGYLTAILAIGAVKLALLLLDPNPRFFLWDSVTYLQGALGGALPRDRSFLYSFLIHAFAVPTHSLHALVIAQTIAGAVTALLAYAMLRDGLHRSHRVALVGALLIAIAPSQLFYEHMLMAEAFGGLLWLAFLALVLAYLNSGRTLLVAAVVLCGIVTIAFRLNGTAVILLTGLLLPLLRAWWVPGDEPRNVHWQRIAMQLALAVACTFALHVGYRHIVANVAHTPPGYIGTEGLFMMGYVAPAIHPDDFRNTGCAEDVLNKVKYDPVDPHNRERELWSEGGLWSVMQRACPQPEKAATHVAHRAFERIGPYVLPMAFSTQAQYFDEAESIWRMQADMGLKGQLPLELINPVRENFFLDVAGLTYTPTLTSVWFEHSRWWLTACFFLSPLLAIALYVRAVRTRDVAGAKMLAIILLSLFVTQFLLSPIISFRYLHPFPPLFVLCGLALLPPRRAPAIDEDQAQT